MHNTEQAIAETFKSRKFTAMRWECSEESVRRKEKSGILTPYKIGGLTRYKMSQILAVENEAAVK